MGREESFLDGESPGAPAGKARNGSGLCLGPLQLLPASSCGAIGVLGQLGSLDGSKRH